MLTVLTCVGVSSGVIAELGRDLPDVFDVDKYGGLFQRYGLTIDDVMSRMGDGP